MQCLWGGFVVAVVATLTVQWMHIDQLKRRLSELEQQMTYSDGHLFNDKQHLSTKV